MSTLKTSNIQHASAASAAITLDANGQATLNGLAYPTSGSLSGRNRIINGDMRIDQRNAGASVTPTTSGTYILDRWQAWLSQASKFSVQRNAGSITPPAGFTNYLGVTSLAATSVGTNDYFSVNQCIEGFNVSDLAWGTASASPVTLSFWVRSSLTGTFSGAFTNGSNNRSYPFTYSIASANTWERKTVTISGDTSGTWASDNTQGLYIQFSLGMGSTYNGTAGAWAAGQFLSATGATSVVGTNGATFYITGVQLEAGSVATPFERRSYGQELRLCQRYYWAPINGSSNTLGVAFGGGGTNKAYHPVVFPVEMRAAPTVGITSTVCLDNNGGLSYYSSHSLAFPSPISVQVMFTASTTVVVNDPYNVRGTDGSSRYNFSAEL